MKCFLESAAAIRKFCEFVAILLFLLYWPAANLYWVICGMLGIAGKAVIEINRTIADAFLVVSVFMAFLLPIWALAVIGIYHIATAVAIASFRPVPFLLLTVAWLEKAQFIPIGHIGIDDAGKMYEGAFNNLLYPAMYSVLAILGGILVLLSVRRKPDTYVCSQGTPLK